MTAVAQDSAPRPNILVVVTDDMGWGQPGFNGGTKVGTPNLDRIANEGVKLTQFYASPGCSPTRSALLTGRHYWKTGGVQERPTRGSTVGMLLDERTIADALSDAAYETWAIGKWHLGKWHSGHLPRQRGFDHHYGMYTGILGYYSHLHTGILDWHRNGRPVVERGYSTFLMAEEAVQLIGRHDGGDPFFLYLAFNAPHGPSGAPQEYLERYAGSRNADQLAQVKALDDALGWVLVALEDKAMVDNTLVVYLNDNGGTTRAGGNAPYRGLKGAFHEGGIRVPAAMRWPGRIPAESESDALLHVVDVFPTLAGLAGASTTDGLPLDGLDAWQAIAEGAESPRGELAHSRKVMRVGDWKLLEANGVSYGGHWSSGLQLYNIAEDPYEQTNLASSEPAKVAELRARLAEHREAARDPSPRSKVPEGVFVFGFDENAAYGADVERALGAMKVGNTGPVLDRVEAAGDTVRLIHDEALDAAYVPPSSAFRVVTPPSYAAVEVLSVEATGSEVVLTLASRLGPGTTVGVTYEVPDSGAIRDADSIEAVGTTWRTGTASSVAPVWRSTVTVEARGEYRGFSSIANPDLGAVAEFSFDYGEGAAHQVQVVMAYSAGVMFQVRNRSTEISGLVLEWAGETLPLAEATWDPTWDRYLWDQVWLDANAPSLNASTYVATLADGSEVDACLRYAEQACTSSSGDSGTASDDATLSLLALSGIDIGTFAAGTASYAATVGHGVSSTQVTATANDANASLAIADASGSTSGASRTVALAVGSNTVTVTVTAEDGTTTSSYTVTVTRAAPASGLPALSVADAAVTEGANAVLSFAVTLSSAGTDAVTVEYATRDGTATAGADYAATAGTLTFDGLKTAATVSVAVLDDTEDEADETLTLVLSNAVGASVAVGSATGTVVDDDPSADAALSSLALSGIDIGTFAAGTASYAATVGHGVSSTQVTATANDANASLAIADASGSTSGASRTVALAVGSNTVTVTVTAEDGTTTATYTVTVTRESAARLTASFESAPASHEGTGAFTVRLRFSEAVAASYRVLRDQALSATGGTVSKVNRVDGRNDLWEVHVVPSGSGAVTLTLDPSTDDCAQAGSVCTSDGRALSNAPSVTVARLPPLTASFGSVPASHDGSAAFTVRLTFSADIAGGDQALRKDALSATGGTVTGVRRVDGRSDLWEVGVVPSGHAAVTLTLDPSTDACGETGSVCTSDGRALSNAPSVTVDGPPPLTAWFGSAPSHDGSTAFTVRLHFSEDVAAGYRVLRDQALSASGGRITKVSRVDGRNDLWEVHVRPSGSGAVTLTLDPSTDDCAEAGSVCTSDGRALSNAPSVTVARLAPLTASFGDAPASHDGSEFTVRLTFSDDIATVDRVLRNDALSATGGTVTNVRRVDGRNDLWDVYAKPSGSAAVTLTLDPATDDCGETGSVCTSDGRALSNAPSVTVSGPASARAEANGALVTVRWSSPRDDFGSPSAADYGVRVNGRARAVVSAELAGATAWLALASPVAAGDAVTVAYLGSAMHPLADAAGRVRSVPWDGLEADNVTGAEPAGVPVTVAPRPADPLASAADGALRLDASGLGLTDLRRVARLTALERLDLSGNAVSDLSPLAGLSNLRDLDLADNAVSDLWPLAGLHGLERLNLSRNAVEDVQALAGLSGLTVLLLGGNAITDAWPLAALERLENLGLARNRIADVAALQDLARLRRLDLAGNPATDLSPLGDVGSLVSVALPGDRVGAPVETLGRLTRLQWVWFGTVETVRENASDRH